MSRQRKSTAIRTARKATNARKRAAFEFQAPIKKPMACAKGYDVCATGSPLKAPAAEPITPHTGAISDEFC